MIPNPEFNIWEHSAIVRELYTCRAQGHDEMDAAAQTVDILAPYLEPGMTVLDAGCGSGYYYWSFKRRNLDIEYYGIDYSPSLIEIGHRELAVVGLPPERLQAESIENLTNTYDVVICCNTLSWCPDFRLPLERLLSVTKNFIVIRTNLGAETMYRYEQDGYLDDGYNHLKAYWNQYSEADMTAFMNDMGFEVTSIIDQRTRGEMELVVGKPYFWKFLFGRRGK